MRLARLATAVLTLLMLGACGDDVGRSAVWSDGTGPEASSAPGAQSASIPTKYDEEADATADIDAALEASKRDGKPVLLNFGANWCPDGRELGRLYQKPAVTRLLQADYHLVLVDLGEFDKNLDIAARYVNLRTSGVPALAVVREGLTVYASNQGQFAIARTMKAPRLRAFLKRWAA
jgi:protein disulfide-isomerase